MPRCDAPVPPLSLRRAYLDGMLVNLLNPKVALFFVAFLPQFIRPDRGPVAAQVVVLGLVIAVIGLASDVLYAFAAGSLGAWMGGRPAFERWQRYVTGGTYVALGLVAALTGRPASAR